MVLNPGTRLGAYEVLGSIGAGGMGEVYRATDTRLGREVALKLLPEMFAADPERLARFDREARLLASLNHPNIAHLYGFEAVSNGAGSTVHLLAMELAEGENLAERLKRGPVPVDEAIGIARQLADALEEAHEKGIVHRDLKPANLMLAHDGKVKVLDFGLAKAWAGERSATSSADLSRSPTLARHGTEAGIILGTAAYMSPEQARGRPVDKRSDIWSFGVVLFELLTGTSPFRGDTVSDVLAAVLTRELDWTTLPTDTPAVARHLLARCLVRDPRDRLRDMGEVRLLLARGVEAPAAVTAAPRQRSRTRVAWAVALVATAIAAALAGSRSADAPTPALVRASLPLPAGLQIPVDASLPPVIGVSPDGMTVAFAAMPIGGTVDQGMLYVRRLDEADPMLVPDSEGARGPFFSPDGRQLAFASRGVLKRVSLSGGAPVALARNVDNMWGATWLQDGTIVYSNPTASGEMLYAVPEGGGEVRLLSRVTRLDADNSFPHAFAGDRMLVTMWTGGVYSDARIALFARETGTTGTILVEGGSNAHVLPGGPLVYARGSELLGVAFDERTGDVRGTPVKLLDGVLTDSVYGTPQFAVSAAGTLVYARQGHRPPAELLRLGVDGTREPLLEDRLVEYARLSPDGLRVAFQGTAESRELDLWTYDVATRRRSRLTQARGEETHPVFSSDRRSIFFAAWRAQASLVRIPVLGGTEQVLREVSRAEYLRPHSASPDGRWLAVTPGGLSRTSANIGLLDLREPGSAPRWLFSGGASYDEPRFSPRGDALAFVSTQLGSAEVWVGAFPGDLGTAVPVSRDGGRAPFWSTDGGKLFYSSGSSLHAVTVTVQGGVLEVSEPQRVLETDGLDVLGATTAGDFIAVQNDGAPVTHVDIVLNWATEVRARLAAAGGSR